MKLFFFLSDVITILLAFFVGSYILDFCCITITPLFASVSFGIVVGYGLVKSIYYFMERDSDVS